MTNPARNRLVQLLQRRTLFVVAGVLITVIILVIALLTEGQTPKREITPKKDTELADLVDESFLNASENEALTNQQAELDSLKKQVNTLSQSFDRLNTDLSKQLETQASQLVATLQGQLQEIKNKSNTGIAGNGAPPNDTSAFPAANSIYPGKRLSMTIHSVSFKPKPRYKPFGDLDPAHYVPANTSVKAIVLGGADADASVNGQSKNNGVMLFKFLDDGTLPNGKHSRLRGCRVSANAYGDISSERAFATLYRLSCAHQGEAIIDKVVTGWVFFNGKVGIKGTPLMRDNKVMQWAGVSGALAGIANAAQSAQSIQQFGGNGASSFVPSTQVAPYAAYGGASKAADTLSQYYVKRAEQYHPVIQVGANNVVTVVFKDGFYLEPDDSQQRRRQRQDSVVQLPPGTESPSSFEKEKESMNFMVPPEVLNQLEQTHSPSINETEVNP